MLVFVTDIACLLWNSRLASMAAKGGAVGAEDTLDLIVIPSQKEKGQKNVEDHELFLEKILKDLVMQRSGGKIWEDMHI